MELTRTEAVQLLDQFYNSRNFSKLNELASAMTTQDPLVPEGWRYLGIAGTLSGNALSKKNLIHAAFLGDREAELWLNVLGQYSHHRSIRPNDLIDQVRLQKLRHSQYMNYPLEVSIETQAVCNAKCSFCPYPTMERQGDKMSDELIDKIIDDLVFIPKDVPFTISPFKVSDPFLDKRIFAVLRKINDLLPHAGLRLFTNGSPLTDRIIQKVAEVRNVKHLWISLNESNALDYERVMGIPFIKTIDKLDSLHKFVALGYPHQVTLSRVVDGSEKDRDFESFVNERYPLFKCFLIGRSDWTGQVSVDVTNIVPQTACARWYEVSIMASGKVALCCMDGEGKYVVGDVNSQSVLDVYNSTNFKRMRQYAFTRLSVASPCDTCTT